MRIAIFLLIVGFCLVSAKYLPRETRDSDALLRIKRSDDSDNSSSSVEQNDDDDDDSDDSAERKLKEKEDKIKRKALEQQEKLKRKIEEEQRKLEEKHAKEQRKLEEKEEKEERKRLERLEKEKRKEEEKIRKDLEKIEKEARKKQEKQRKLLQKLEKEALEGNYDDDILETEEENSVELADIWRNHIYVKYGLNLASSRVEKQAALNRYLQEELKLSQNSTEKERRQAIVKLIQSKLQSNAIERSLLKNQLLSHVNAVSIQKLRANLEKDLEELNNKTNILNNVTLPWVPLAKQQIEEKRSFIQTIIQLLSNILPNWITGGQNEQNPNKNNSSSVVNGSQSSNSYGASNTVTENNINTAFEGNRPTGNSDVPFTQSNDNENAQPNTADVSYSVQVPSIPEGSGAVASNTNDTTIAAIGVNDSQNTGSETSGDKLPVGAEATGTASVGNNVVSVTATNAASTYVIDNAPAVSSTDNSVLSSEGNNAVPVDNTGKKLTSNNNIVEAINVGAASTVNTDNIPITSVDEISSGNSVAGNVLPTNNGLVTSVGSDSGSDVVSPSLSGVSISQGGTSSGTSAATLGNDSNVTSISNAATIDSDNIPSTAVIDNKSPINPNVNSAVNSDTTVNNTDNSTLDATASIVNISSSQVNVISDSNANLTSPISTDSTVNINLSGGSEVNLENSVSGTPTNENYNALSSDIVSTGNSNSPSASDNEQFANFNVIPSEGNKATLSNVSKDLAVTDNILDASLSTTSSGGSEATSVGGDVNAANVIGNSPPVDSVSVSTVSSSTTSVNNKDTVPSGVLDTTSPATNIGVSSVDSELVNPVNDLSLNVADNGLYKSNNETTSENSNLAKVDSSGSVPEERVVDVTSGSITNNHVKIVDTADNSSPVTNNTLPSITNGEAKLGPEIINGEQTPSDVVGTSAIIVSISTESPIQQEPGSEILTTVLSVSLETAITSETPLIQTSQPSAVETVPPVELTAPLELSDGITMPVEPGASVVDILPQ